MILSLGGSSICVSLCKINDIQIMAHPIQDTPIIKGEDAKRFRKELLESFTKKLTPEGKAAKKKEIKEMEESYNLLVSISRGNLY